MSANSAKAKADPGFESNPDLWINLYVCRIAPKMYWIHSLVSASHFAKYRKNLPVTMRTNKSPKIPYSTKRNGKVTWNAYLGSDHHQKLISYRGSPFADHVWLTSTDLITLPALA